jgi:hypothetical protein
VKPHKSCAFRPTIKTEQANPVADTAHFWNHPRRCFQIYPDLCGFVLGFVWTPETQTMTSLAPHQLGDVRVALNFLISSWLNVYSAQAWCAPLFSVENQRLEYFLQRFNTSMRFRNDSVFAEMSLNRINRNRIVFTRFSSVWTGPKCFCARHI